MLSDLTLLCLADNGKPISHARIDLHLVLETIRYYAGWADKLCGKTIPVNGDVRGSSVFDTLAYASHTRASS